MSEFKISIVIPVYNEESQICESLRTIHGSLAQSGINHDFVLIDDGSNDSTWFVIKDLSRDIPGINAIRLSRNFGKEAALCAGIDTVKADACIIMDADLQHPPEVIPKMVRLWRDEGFEVVEGVKTIRGRERFINKVGASLFYSMLHRLSGFDLDRASDFKLLDVKVISAWRLMNERNTFFRGMSAWVGFNRTSIPFEVADRKYGNSKWSILRLLKLAVTAMTSFSSLPLQIVTFMGIAFFICSFFLGIQTLYKKFAGIAFSGFTTVILLLLIMGSTLMISLGIIGTYIAKIFDEVKYRPRYLVAERLESWSKVELTVEN